MDSGLLLYAIVVHLVCDWLLQNHWMANHKHNLRHPAAWTHGGIHFIGMLLVFPPLWALVIALTHMLIDTRVPLNWWRRVYRQTTEGVYAPHVAIWGDQVAHIGILALIALIHFR